MFFTTNYCCFVRCCWHNLKMTCVKYDRWKRGWADQNCSCLLGLNVGKYTFTCSFKTSNAILSKTRVSDTLIVTFVSMNPDKVENDCICKRKKVMKTNGWSGNDLRTTQRFVIFFLAETDRWKRSFTVYFTSCKNTCLFFENSLQKKLFTIKKTYEN